MIDQSIVIKGDLLSGSRSGDGYDHCALLCQLLRRPGRVDAAGLPVLAAVGYKLAAQRCLLSRSLAAAANDCTARTMMREVTRRRRRIDLAITASMVGYSTIAIASLRRRRAHIITTSTAVCVVIVVVVAMARSRCRGATLCVVSCIVAP